ncbi:MAG TPA: hypothetical protein VGI06_13065, partial [Acidimicrobiales bacterium]
RVRGGDLRDLYARLGTVVSERFDGWRVGLLAADTKLAAATGLDLSPALETDSGGIPVRLLVGGPKARRGRPVRLRPDGHIDRRRLGERRAPR